MKQLISDIETMRQALNMSKQDLCRGAEISYEYYHKITTGKAPAVAYNVLESLANQVGISLTHGLNQAFITDKLSRKG